MKMLFCFLFFVFLFTGCTCSEDKVKKEKVAPEKPKEIVSHFQGGSGWVDEPYIWIIVDKKTGVEYIAFKCGDGIAMVRRER